MTDPHMKGQGKDREDEGQHSYPAAQGAAGMNKTLETSFPMNFKIGVMTGSIDYILKATKGREYDDNQRGAWVCQIQIL